MSILIVRDDGVIRVDGAVAVPAYVVHDLDALARHAAPAAGTANPLRRKTETAQDDQSSTEH